MYQNTQHLANSKRKEMIEFVCINSCITLSLPNRSQQLSSVTTAPRFPTKQKANQEQKRMERHEQ
jgi:hypothetical protein